MQRLIIHAPTVTALHRAYRNLANFLDKEPEALVELVVNGEAVVEAINAPDPRTNKYIVLCENSLRAAGLTAPAGFRTVPAAIHHISQRQAEGWSYFRA